MRRRFVSAAYWLGIMMVGAAIFAGSAAADGVFHTERLELSGLDGAPGGGTVVDIHANGPNVYAHEIYVLDHAVAGTYQVSPTLYLTSVSCTGPSESIPTATITTNAEGNGTADAKFTPDDVAGLRGTTFSIRWTVTGPATYVTDCAVVTLD